MAKNTQTIRQQPPKNCLSVFDRIVGLALKGFNLYRYSEDAYSLQMRLNCDCCVVMDNGCFHYG